MENLSVENKYQFYLKLMGLNESTMHPQQKVQLRETFYAAFILFMEMLRADISQLDEVEAIEALNHVEEQLKDYVLNKMHLKN